MLSNPNAAVDTVYHSDWGRIVATLIRFCGDFDVAEEAAQSYERALALVTNESERRFLQRRLREVQLPAAGATSS